MPNVLDTVIKLLLLIIIIIIIIIIINARALWNIDWNAIYNILLCERNRARPRLVVWYKQGSIIL